jgi:ParB-like nuclease domain
VICVLLADSIAEAGLLHPVLVMPEGRLIAGQRRLEACHVLGWSEVPVKPGSQSSRLTQLQDEDAFWKWLQESKTISHVVVRSKQKQWGLFHCQRAYAANTIDTGRIRTDIRQEPV